MSYVKKVVIVLLVSMFILFIPGLGLADNTIYPVSMLSLIDNPEEYHGKQVTFQGVCCIKFEDCAIYLSKEDQKNQNAKNAVWLVYYDAIKYQQWNGKYVTVVGKYNKDDTGHFNCYSGAIEQVTKFELLSSEKDLNDENNNLWVKSWWLLLLVPIMAFWWYRVRRCQRRE